MRSARIYNLLVLLVMVQSIVYSHGDSNKNFFRSDYTYLDTTQNFYKLHTARRTWDDAKTRCELEGATLFYPEDGTEAEEVTHFWNQTQSTIDSIFIGIKAFYARQAFLTIERRSLNKVYNNWAPGAPYMYYDDANCVILNATGTIEDVQCQTRKPFICKKRLDHTQWNEDCNTYDTDYVYSNTTGHCYKFHINPKNWTEAVDTCYAEQSYLAIIDNYDEAGYLSWFARGDHGQDNRDVALPNVMYMGFYREPRRIWLTIKGVLLERSSYHEWADGEPTGAENEKCGSMLANNGKLNDQTCYERLFFICKHDLEYAPHLEIDMTTEKSI